MILPDLYRVVAKRDGRRVFHRSTYDEQEARRWFAAQVQRLERAERFYVSLGVNGGQLDYRTRGEL